MPNQDTVATRIIDLWPGDTRAQRRQALARALGHKDEEKVRYWQKSGQIPRREWQGIIDAGVRTDIMILPNDFVRDLRVPAEAAALESGTA
jgi:hypothetical protein